MIVTRASRTHPEWHLAERMQKGNRDVQKEWGGMTHETEIQPFQTQAVGSVGGPTLSSPENKQLYEIHARKPTTLVVGVCQKIKNRGTLNFSGGFS